MSVREALRKGDAVMIDIDSSLPVPHGFTIETGRFTVHVSEAAPRMAERCGALVAYVRLRAEGAGVCATITSAADVPLRRMFESWLSSPS